MKVQELVHLLTDDFVEMDTEVTVQTFAPTGDFMEGRIESVTFDRRTGKPRLTIEVQAGQP